MSKRKVHRKKKPFKAVLIIESDGELNKNQLMDMIIGSLNPTMMCAFDRATAWVDDVTSGAPVLAGDIEVNRDEYVSTVKFVPSVDMLQSLKDEFYGQSE